MATTPKSSPNANDVEAQIKTIRDDVATLTSLLKDLAEDRLEGAKKVAHDEAEELLKKSKDATRHAKHRARQATSSMEEYIAEKPVQSTLIALLIGIFIGSLSRR